MADNRILARIAKANGGKVLNAAIDALLPVEPGAVKRGGLIGVIAGAVMVRIATRSVPGAIVIGGAVLAKRIHDRKQNRAARKTPENPPSQA